MSSDGKKALVTLASGDMRKALNILQVYLYVLICSLPMLLMILSQKKPFI